MSCANVCEDSEIKYVGDGSKTLFTFPFTYMEQSDVYVEIFNETTRRWAAAEDPYTWSFANTNTIEFTTAPPTPTESGLANIKIRRCTEIDPLSATFYPGSAIRAQDLNDNFFQLRLAIEEGKCFVPQWLFDYLDKYYWNKGNDTTYSTDDWNAEADDKHVPTTGAVKQYVDEQDDKKIDKTSIVTLEDQKLGRWTSTSNLNSDENVPSTAATSERHDAFFQDTTPVNVPAYRTPGRRWVDTGTMRAKVWDQQEQNWLDFTETGPQGPKGDEGTYSTIVSDTPPIKRNNNKSIQNGDVWFNSNTGELFVYYQDGNSNQWVAAVSTVKGDTGADGADGNFCTVSDTPPSAPKVGDTWFNTDCPTGLYVWDGTQWIGTSIPGPKGADGSGVYTFTAPLTESSGTVSFNIQSLNELI